MLSGAQIGGNDRHHHMAIVDDDDAVLDSLKFFLELLGCQVRAYNSAQSFFDDLAPLPACLILDQHMPQMTGLELAARLRADGIDIPMLLITGLPSPELIERAATLGIARVLEKPPAEDELVRFVQAHC